MTGTTTTPSTFLWWWHNNVEALDVIMAEKNWGEGIDLFLFRKLALHGRTPLAFDPLYANGLVHRGLMEYYDNKAMKDQFMRLTAKGRTYRARLERASAAGDVTTAPV